MEQGEIPDDNPASGAGDIVFELRFPHRSDYEKWQKKLIGALNSVFGDETVALSTVNDGENGVCIRAVRSVEKANGANDLDDDPDEEGQIRDGSNGNDDAENSNTKRNDKEQSPDYTGLSELFMIDTAPATKLDTVQVPSYKRTIKETLDDDELERKKQKKTDDDSVCKRPARMTSECFNCGSRSHSLRDCPKPRNNQRITRAKKAKKHERYHVDIEQRFAHLRPGVLSKSLRDAMGLRRGELPFFFYRMRALGYPPGWLEDAKVSHSGISLFNQNGVEVLNSDDDERDVDGLKHKYDVMKIIDFPGFNADPGKNCFDDYEHHNVPPINQEQMKDAFIKSLGSNVIEGYRQKKLKNVPAAEVLSTVDTIPSTPLEPTDMEIENDDEHNCATIEFERPPPPTTTIPADCTDPLPPPPPAKELRTERGRPITRSGERSQSPSLADLEAQQEQLLQELNANMSNLTEHDDSLIDEVIELDKSQDSTTTSSRDVTPVTPIAPVTPSTPNDASLNAPVTPTSSANISRKLDVIKMSHVGTPLLHFSPYDKLPAGDNFKVGVSDVINFENLPDSTGKYEQMKLVIQKVRIKRQELSKEDD